jgi:hypothetical protein
MSHPSAGAVDVKLRRVEIRHFRGIRELNWDLAGEFICLIGRGDSTKTTILDAIELALTGRWNVAFDDADFHKAKPEDPIDIAVTIGDLPDELKSDSKLGYWVQGWSPAGELHDEPEDGDELVLTVRLRVDDALEPSWTVTNLRSPEGKVITARDREKLGCARLGDFLDRHFSWGRGSVLTRLTTEVDQLSSVMAVAARAARQAFSGAAGEAIAPLTKAAEKVDKAGQSVGVRPRSSTGYEPRLDTQQVSIGAGGLALHDGEVPVRRAGLGTRRLLALAAQREAATAGGLALVDEIEHGLEPHRVRHLLRVLRGRLGSSSHVLMTSHSPVVVSELSAAELHIVRSVDGSTTVRRVPDALQGVVRKASEAFLASRVIVCEGKTELGFCRRLDEWWADSARSFALSGIALADGGGESASEVARAFADLGYDVALICDSDREVDPSVDDLRTAGVEVITWKGSVAIEERVALDLPKQGLVAFLKVAIKEKGLDSARDAVRAQLPLRTVELAEEPKDWFEAGVSELHLRRAIGLAAKKNGWFKRAGVASRMAEVVVRSFRAMSDTDLARKISELRAWAHETDPGASAG